MPLREHTEVPEQLHPLYTFRASPAGNACCLSEELSRFPLEVESERDKGPQLELFNQTK